MKVKAYNDAQPLRLSPGMIQLVWFTVCTFLLLLTRTVVESGGCLVHGEDKELGDVDVRWTGGRPNDLLRDVLSDH